MHKREEQSKQYVIWILCEAVSQVEVWKTYQYQTQRTKDDE
jgi:hypothetical protein